MTRRRVLRLGSVVIAIGLVIAWLLWPRSAITPESAARIEKGMTLAEVQAIMGGPPRDEATGPVEFDRLLTIVEGDNPQCWESDTVAIRVYFDERGQAAKIRTIPVRRADQSLLDRLRRWLGL